MLSSSSSSSKASLLFKKKMAVTKPAKESSKSKSLNSVPKSLLLSSAVIQTPFVPPFLRPSKPNLVPVVPQNIIRELHGSIVSTADKFLNFLRQNSVFKNILSLSSEFQSFCNEVTDFIIYFFHYDTSFVINSNF